MGSWWSKPPPPQPLLQECWREDVAWGDKKDMVDKLRKSPQGDPELSIRVLLYGPVGAGKSSFVNSVQTVFADHVVKNAVAENNSDVSCTRRYETYYIQDGNGRLPFMLNDIMGLESQKHGGVHIDDIVSALEGHIPEDYAFNPMTSFANTKPQNVQKPELTDKVHCLVGVVNADNMHMMPKEMTAKMRAVRQKAIDLGIPQIVVMTKVDTACEAVKDNLKNIYKSKEIRTKMQMCSNDLGVPLNCILPVKNYSEELKKNNDIDVLILEAMINIVEVANDYLSQKKHQTAD